jgi:hypothetical protein
MVERSRAKWEIESNVGESMLQMWKSAEEGKVRLMKQA